ncbi:hypothetical protein MKL73_00710 [Brucella abortus]|uniref:Uncharacterized protein n=10 Tax=Brucella TaxID=234 RepID=Q2YPT5_BRUA2|nr:MULTISPECIES: hypothetical protein [Brucella]AAN30322.1 hypothetical protein BR1409 [Brucella suis 1330]AAX74734.1 hypothetical protein BruAb1_1404 [Brucella abortus bv. 1 str. 9-941]ABX62473.1 Hypothetical protein BCAN_A1442 [Brucella canis ATCC 23365]ABY38498.1 Hypothetical protein BSUIS_A1460 [Brucella suis ATCC 23445]ACD72830.1 hypothetical protein BAbS19_I13350 [Brucella abortus S19]ACO01170.1 Hypothetical protein, conserved [Brucella melitensis ATCC 23457]ACU48387.1 hypothetical pro
MMIQISHLDGFAEKLIQMDVHIDAAVMQFALLSAERCRYVAQIKTA